MLGSTGTGVRHTVYTRVHVSAYCAAYMRERDSEQEREEGVARGQSQSVGHASSHTQPTLNPCPAELGDRKEKSLNTA